jgi:hypothetical protein
MRYERVQDILENEPAFRNRISPKTQVVESRFGERKSFSKETVEITEALHAEGKDAHKAAKGDVLKMAAQVLKIISSNGESHPPVAISAPVAPVKSSPKPAAKPVEQVAPAPPPKKKKTKALAPPKVEPAKPKPEPAKIKSKKPEPKPPAIEPKVARLTRPESKPQPVAPLEVPESELPPEKQPLRLPRDFDPSKFPHYSVQSSIYGLLLSALSLAEHYERFPNSEERRKDLESILKKYLTTCDSLQLKTT